MSASAQPALALASDIRSNPDEFTAERIAQEVQLAASKLTVNQVNFIEHYIATSFNATRAYDLAGFKSKSAAVSASQASTLLRNQNVGNYLAWRLREVTQQSDVQIDQNRLIRETNALAYSSLTDVIRWDADGNIRLRPADEIPREVAVAIKKIRSTTRVIPRPDDEPIRETKIEVEMHDKKGALDLQAKIAGLMQNESQGEMQPFIFNMYIGQQPKEKDVSPVAEG
jgi:hypothetical protein